jgi:peptide/nickel transport system permease protein
LPILFGVNVLLFTLFFIFTTPDRIARLRVGPDATLEQVEGWKSRYGYNLPRFYNEGWKPVVVREFRQAEFLRFLDLEPGFYRIRLGPSRDSIDAKLSLATASPVPKAMELAWKDPIYEPAGTVLPEGFSWKAGLRKTLRSVDSAVLEFTVAPNEKLIWGMFSEIGGVQIYVDHKDEIPISQRFSTTLFFEKCLRFLWFDFGRTDEGKSQAAVIAFRIVPSLLVTIPAFLIGVGLEIVLALLLVRFRDHWIESAGIVGSTLLLSVSILFIAIGAQWIFGKELHLFPVTGFSPDTFMPRFVAIPIFIGVLGYLGAGIRWYRAIFLNESDKLYIQRARSFGVDEPRILFSHILRNSIAPVLTTAIGALPGLIMGSIAIESIFEIPGLGTFTLDAIRKQDFNGLQATVFIGALFYILAYLVIDLLTAAFDPRMELR